MRFWIKIVVALSVVVVLGFGVWAFFFREDDNIAAYNSVSEFVDYKKSLNIEEKLNNLKLKNYITKEDVNVIIDDSTDTKKEILNLREVTLSEEIISYYDEGGNLTCLYDSYYEIEEISDDMISYLLPYLKYTNSKDSEIRQLKSIIGDYINHLKELDESITLVVECQETIQGSDTEYEVLYGKYYSYYLKYRKVLNDSARLINSMMSNIKSNVGDLKLDTTFALVDSFGRSLNVSTSVEDKREPLFAYDLHFVIDKYNKFIDGDNIYSGEYSEYEFLNSYNNLINNYPSILDQVFEKHNMDKKKIADGEGLSDIKQEAHEFVITVFNVLGF